MSGRVAVVTGGAGAISAAIATALAQAGHAVPVLDRAGDIACDLADEAAVRHAAMDVGRCDVLVHAAAAFDRATLAEVDRAAWRHVQAVNVESALWLAQALAPGMAARGWGRIVHVVRAGRLGRNVAEQIGRAFDDVEYRGDEPGVCPLCHLDVFVLRGSDVECATCGARGTLGADGVQFTEDGLKTSVISLHEKREHFFEIQQTAGRHQRQREQIEAGAAPCDAYDRRVAPPSSAQ